MWEDAGLLTWLGKQSLFWEGGGEYLADMKHESIR